MKKVDAQIEILKKVMKLASHVILDGHKSKRQYVPLERIVGLIRKLKGD